MNNKNTANPIKYILYARKSSESDDRQVQSIDSQLAYMNELAKSRNLNIVAQITEAASSKNPGRKGFNELVARIESGEANGIISWAADRLSRNAIDSGRLIYLFDQLKLVEIVTQGHVYVNEPTDKFMLSINLGQAKADNDNKGVAVKRGMRTKASTGWYPSFAPIGYLNTPELSIGKRYIKTDELRFPYLKQCWKEVIKGTPIFVSFEHALAKWKLAGHSEKFVSRSAFYAMFRKPFYYGKYEYPVGSGLWTIGNHKPMITHDEFDSVQKQFGLSKPCRRTHTLPFKGVFRCGVCNCLITATKKTKFVKKDDLFKPYIYYHCTRKKPQFHCEEPRVNNETIINQIAEIIESFRVPTEFAEWAKKWNEYLDHNEVQKTSLSQNKVKEQLSRCDQSLKELRGFLLRGTLNDVEYLEEKNKIEEQIKNIKKQSTEKPRVGSKEILDQLDFAVEASKRFRKGDIDKREIVQSLGSNYLLSDGKVSIQLRKTYLIFQKFRKGSYIGKGEFELSKYADVLSKRPDLKPLNPSWLGDMDSNHDKRLQRPLSCR